MEKGYNHAWSQIIADRGVRQRLAIFATRRLVETSTCGLPPGSVLVVSGVEAAQSPAGLPLHVVRIGEGTRQIESLSGILPRAGAGEADIKTPLLLTPFRSMLLQRHCATAEASPTRTRPSPLALH